MGIIIINIIIVVFIINCKFMYNNNNSFLAVKLVF